MSTLPDPEPSHPPTSSRGRSIWQPGCWRVRSTCPSRWCTTPASSCSRMCRPSRTASARRSARSACCVSSGTGAGDWRANHRPSTRKENLNDQSILVSAPRHSSRRHFQRRIGVLLRFGAGELAPLLNLPEALLSETGLFLIAYTALVGWLGTRQAMPKALVVIVIAGNAAWTIASIALLFCGTVTPNLLGESLRRGSSDRGGRPRRTAICRMAKKQRRAGGLGRGLLIRPHGRRGIPEFHGNLRGSFGLPGSFDFAAADFLSTALDRL